MAKLDTSSPHQNCQTLTQAPLAFYCQTVFFPMAKLIKLAKMAGVMHEADHAYSIRSTW